MFKVISKNSSIGGTLDNQRGVIEKTFKDLEKELNSLPVESVVGIYPARTDSEIELIAVVKLVEPAKKGKEGK